MVGILESVNQRTQLVGQNRLELLLFKLNSPQIYGINVFKVKEVLQCPKLTILPKSHAVVRGVAHIRFGTIPIIDLGMATGNPPIDDINQGFIIIAEYNMTVQGFLVKGVERIVNMNWEDILPPPKGAGKDHYLTAVTKIDEKIVEIVDVEKVLSEVSPLSDEVSSDIVKPSVNKVAENYKVLAVDDSVIARKQIQKCLKSVGVELILKNDGRQAWDHLCEVAKEGNGVLDEYLLLISDIEMPEMDGYTLTTNVKNDARMSQLPIILHTSLSGVFNKAMVEKVGADDFIAKFNPDLLAEKVVEFVESRHQSVS